MSSISNENKVTPEEHGPETTKQKPSVTETATNNTIKTSYGINYIITSCTPKDMKGENPILNWDSEMEENLSEFHKSVASSEITISDAKSEARDDTEECIAEFYSQQVIQQNKMLSDLNMACEGIFQLDRQLSEETSLSTTPCPPKIRPNADYGFFVETWDNVTPCEANIGPFSIKSDSNQTLLVNLDEEQTMKEEQPKEITFAKDDLDDSPTKDTGEFPKQTFEENKNPKVFTIPQNPNTFHRNLVHYTTERLEDMARRNYEAARAVFKSKENECLQNASLEIAIKNIFYNKAETRNVREKTVSEKDFSILYQNSVTNETQQELTSQKSKRKPSSISCDSWMHIQRSDANKKTHHMDAGKTRKTIKRPVSQISDKVSLKQFVTPEGLEESSREKKKTVEDVKERGDDLTVKTKPAVVSYEDLMRVLASPTSESSIFTDAARTRTAADGLRSSPSDSRLLKSERRAAAAAAEKKKAAAPRVKNLEEELHYHNPFQAVFRRAGFTDVNQLYRFMDYEYEEDLEELQKPLPPNYIGDLIKKIQHTDKQIRAMHKEMFEGGLMAKLAPYFAMCKKMREGTDSESDEEEEDDDEEEESSSEGDESADE